MAQPTIQTAYHSGEWADALNARVDLAKYKSACALGLNYFVDYRGGLSSRPGTQFLNQAFKSATAVRVITFQASTTVAYALEFGDFYVRFFNNGAPVLESSINITAATQAAACVVTIPGHNYVVGDWFFIDNIVGMTQLNDKYYRVKAVAGNDITLGSVLNNSNINSTGYTGYISGGTGQRIYTLATPFAADDLALLKFITNINKMYLTHPSYPPQLLTLISATNWTIAPVPFGPGIAAPTNVAVTSSISGSVFFYSYLVTAVTATGEESPVSNAGLITLSTILNAAQANVVTWTAVSGAVSYNVYRTIGKINSLNPAGAAHGYIGNCTGTAFADNGIAPDFSETTPVSEAPFTGVGIASVTVGTQGNYSGSTAVPSVSVAAPPLGRPATLGAVLEARTIVISNNGTGYAVGDTVSFPNGVVAVVATINGTGGILTFEAFTFAGSARGGISGGSTPANPVAATATSGVGINATVVFTWQLGSVTVLTAGSGYLTAPAITFSSGAATATAVLAASSAGNPSVSSFYNQRFVLAAQPQAPQSFFMSQPAAPYNFNTNIPLKEDNAIYGSIVSNQSQSIKSLVPMPSGLIAFTDRAAWLLNGGTNGEPVTPINIGANSQANNGATDVPPIVANSDILFVQAKGSVIRYLTYNFNSNIFTGTDISILSSHLFFGYQILEWAWAEEPYKLVWAIRDDGMALSLTFMREQELIGWTHSDTQGAWKSVCTVTEAVDGFGYVDATYWVVEREIDGETVKYIERMADRLWTIMEDAWCVDAGLRYTGTARTSFSGAEHLAGMDCVGLASGIPFEATVDANGNFTIATASGNVLIGLAFTPDFMSLALDLGEPTVQSKRKKIPAIDVRVKDTLGLSAGKTFDTLVPMKDLILGNVGSMSNEPVTNLVTGDARTLIDPQWDPFGQYCIRQPYPLPATILGIMPEVTVGDTPKAK